MHSSEAYLSGCDRRADEQLRRERQRIQLFIETWKGSADFVRPRTATKFQVLVSSHDRDGQEDRYKDSVW